MEVRVQYQNGVLFEATARGHRVLCDQPLSNGGTDQGMTPPEFLLTALATCAGYYAAEYLRARKLPVAGLDVRVSAGKATQPARLDGFRIEVAVPGLEGRHLEGVDRAVKACLIHNTLLHAPKIETVVRGSNLAAAA
jgi:putative redox protein